MIRLASLPCLHRPSTLSLTRLSPPPVYRLQPLTYLKPSGRTEEVDTGDASFTIIDVVPRM